ncbi:MobA/MobL family protein [Klebsiella michiganensis]|nr:MobA/MobL family protein [Klebsiella pneumoniae]
MAKVAYHNRAKIEDTRTGQTYDYSRRTDLALHKILSPASAPAELVADSGTLWNTIEHLEKRKDAQLCRSFDISLHNELSEQENIDLFLAFAQKSFVEKGMVADLAFHRGTNGDNFHVHGALSLRSIDKNGFGKKVREWNEHTLVEEWRQEWARMSNQALKSAGHISRIDNRSLKAQHLEALAFAEAATDPNHKAALVATAIELDREPMKRISAKSWHTTKSQDQRALDRLKRDQSLLEAAEFYHEHRPAPVAPAVAPVVKAEIQNKIKSEPKKPAPAKPAKPVASRSKTRVKKSPKKDPFWNKFGNFLKTRLKSATYAVKKALNNSSKNNDLDDYDDPMESMANFLDQNPAIAKSAPKHSYTSRSDDFDRKPSKDLTNEPEIALNRSNEPDPGYTPRKLKR